MAPYDARLDGFWSLTLYTNTYNLVEGSTLYSINSYDPKFQARDSAESGRLRGDLLISSGC